MPVIDSIPQSFQEGFNELALLDNNKFNAITDGLSRTPFKSSISKLVEIIAKKTSILPEEFEDIFLSVSSLVDFLDKGVKIPEIVDDIISIGKNDNVIEFKDENHEKDFKSRLTFLLENEQIYYAYKANDLATELGSLFLRSKIVTDIRPIFNAALDESPKVGLITHTLHIHYNLCEETGHRDVYIAMDSNDLNALRVDLERAQQKELNLLSMFKETGMINLND